MTVRRLPIPTCSSDFLNVTLKTLWHAEMYHTADISLVQSHAECHCSYYNPQLTTHECFLDASSLVWAQTSMVTLSNQTFLFTACKQ